MRSSIFTWSMCFRLLSGITGYRPVRIVLPLAPGGFLLGSGSLRITRCNALILPFGDLGIDPADTTTTERHRLGEIAAGHPFINCRMAKASCLFDLVQPQETAHRSANTLLVRPALVFGDRRHQLSPKHFRQTVPNMLGRCRVRGQEERLGN